MMVSVLCKKCGETGRLDIGEMSKEEVIKALKKQGSFNCFGNHVELTTPLDYWQIQWDTLRDEKSPTEEQFVDNLKRSHAEVYTTDELRQKYNVINFSMGMCIAENKDDNVRKTFDFVSSPKGKRYYIA